MNQLYCVLKRSHVVDEFPRWESLGYFESYEESKSSLPMLSHSLRYMDIVTIVSAENVVNVNENSMWIGVVNANGVMLEAPMFGTISNVHRNKDWLHIYEGVGSSPPIVSDMIEATSCDIRMTARCLSACFRHSFVGKLNEEVNNSIIDMEILGNSDIASSFDIQKSFDAAIRCGYSRNYDSNAEAAYKAWSYLLHLSTKENFGRYYHIDFINICEIGKDSTQAETELACIISAIAPLPVVILANLGEYNELK